MQIFFTKRLYNHLSLFYSVGMKLSEYLKQKKLSKEQFARLLGCSRQAVHLWASGQQKPAFDYLMAIEETTKGKVKANDFM